MTSLIEIPIKEGVYAYVPSHDFTHVIVDVVNSKVELYYKNLISPISLSIHSDYMDDVIEKIQEPFKTTIMFKS